MNNILKIRKRLQECLKETEKELKTLTFMSEAWYKSKGEVLGYKTAIEITKRVEEEWERMN